VDLELSDEQTALIDLFASIGERFSTSEQVRAHEALGHSPELWRQLVAAGAPGIALAEELGGANAGLLDVALMLEVLGARLAPAPMVEHTVAARLLARATGTLPEGVADGSTLVTIALRPPIDGVARLVPAGAVADVVIALDGEELVAVTAPPPGAAVPNLASAPLAHRDLGDGDRARLASGLRAQELYEDARSEWRALTGAALVGVGMGALEITRAYVTERHQFGKAIGSFQAIQHTLADIAVALDGAQLLARKAAWAFDTQRDGAADLGAMALLFAAEHAQHAAERGLHFHGGYGFMQEYDIQLYYRRAKGWPLVIDSPAHELQRLAAHRYGALVGAG
jgi:alkylation response protein AidB-like acyl-CoA dehydrogenase